MSARAHRGHMGPVMNLLLPLLPVRRLAVTRATPASLRAVTAVLSLSHLPRHWGPAGGLTVSPPPPAGDPRDNTQPCHIRRHPL